MSPVRVVASVLLAAAALVAAGPLTADAAPTPPVAPPVSGILGAVSGLASALPPIHVTVGQGPGAVDVTVDAGATRAARARDRAVRGAETWHPDASHTDIQAGPSPVTERGRDTTLGDESLTPCGRAGRTPGRVVAQPRRRVHRDTAPARTPRPPCAPTVPADGPLSSPSHAVQALLRWSLGSDRTMLVLLGVTAAGALAAMGTVLAMGRRPGLRRAPVG